MVKLLHSLGLAAVTAVFVFAESTPLLAADAPRDAQVLQMVEQHLPQLTRMLDYLREHSPRKYERAMRDLSRQARRLEASRKRGEHFYANELESLKVETRIDLTVAKLRLSDEPRLREQLRSDIRKLQRLRIERLSFEREALRLRIEKATEQLAAVEQRLRKVEQSGDSAAQQSYETLLRKAGLPDVVRPAETSSNRSSSPTRPMPLTPSSRKPQS